VLSKTRDQGQAGATMSETHYLHEVARDGKLEKVKAWINYNPDLVFSPA
jgi:hypothetical protein